MSYRNIVCTACFVVFATFFGARTCRAQDEPQQPPPDNTQQPPPDNTQQPPPDNNEPFPGGPPKPAGFAFPGLFGTGEGELQPDFSPLTGFQNPTLGFPGIGHSYWVPGLQYSSTIQSNPSPGPGIPSWYAYNYVIGNVSLREAWDRGTLAINYSGGGSFSTESSIGSGYYQRLGLAYTYRTERWLFQIVDSFAQSPQSTFGYGGGTGLGIPGVGGSLGTTIPGLGGNYALNQSIYGVGPFISNVGALQVNYALSRRSSITVAGSYGLLHFTQPGNVDTNSTVASIGYNYILSRNNTIGVVYRFSAYQYPGIAQAYGDQVVSFAYGRKVTGRLGLRILIGPEFTHYRIPIGTTSQTTGFSAAANLTYAFERNSIFLNYLHGLYGGSGVLIGSITDDVSAGFSRKLTRAWTGNLTVGYARNSAAGGTAGNGGYAPYTDWFMTAGVNRPIGRNLQFGAAYTATIGNYEGYGCVGPGCVTSSNRTYNTITINVQWHARPFVLQ